MGLTDMTMQLRDFFASAVAADPTAIALEGVFVIARGLAYLVPTIEAKDDLSQSIALDYEQLKPLLMSKVPAYGGGPYLYCDQVVVEGIVSPSVGDMEASFVLRDIAAFSLTRRGRVFQVLP